MKEQLLQINGADVREKLVPIPMPESHVGAIRADLSGTVFGQDEALQVVAQRVGIIESGLSPRDKPLGAIFLLGGTGTGKTETSHSLAKRWFGDPESERLKIINCSEFTQPHTITRLVGSPPSYVGWRESAALPHDLINAKDKNGNPQRTIVVLDEFEKAHPDVHQLFLGALDKGRLDARNGEKGIVPLDFRNTLFLFTSNISADKIQAINDQRQIGFASDTPAAEKSRQISAAVKEEMNQAFSPEFRNRLTDVVVYQTLERDSGVYEQIFLKFMQRSNTDLAYRLKGHSPYLMATRELIASVIDSIDTTYGARDLSRAIEKQILSRFTDLLMGMDLSGKVVIAHCDDDGTVGFYTDNQPYTVAYLGEEWSVTQELETTTGTSHGSQTTNQEDPNDGTRYLHEDINTDGAREKDKGDGHEKPPKL